MGMVCCGGWEEIMMKSLKESHITKKKNISHGTIFLILAISLFFSCEKKAVENIDTTEAVTQIENKATTEEAIIFYNNKNTVSNSETGAYAEETAIFDYYKNRNEQLVLLDKYIEVKGITVNRRSSESLNSAGFAAYEKKEYVDAVRFFREAMFYNATNRYAHYNLACCLSLLLSQNGDNENAIKTYNLYPSNSASVQTMLYDELYDNLAATFELSETHIEKSQTDSDLLFIRNQERFHNLIKSANEELVSRIVADNYRDKVYNSTPVLSLEEAEAIIAQYDKAVISLIKERDYQTLSDFIHPEYGVRISMFNDASTDDTILSKNDITKPENVYKWGNEPGSGFLIEMSIDLLFDKFIYRKDFIQYETLYNYSRDTISYYGEGNEYVFYDKCIAVYHLYRGDESIAFLDWCGIKIIYQQALDSKWYVSGIIYCEREM